MRDSIIDPDLYEELGELFAPETLTYLRKIRLKDEGRGFKESFEPAAILQGRLAPSELRGQREPETAGQARAEVDHVAVVVADDPEDPFLLEGPDRHRMTPEDQIQSADGRRFTIDAIKTPSQDRRYVHLDLTQTQTGR